MKILQVITSMRIGGAEKLVSEISPLIRDKGCEVDVALFDGHDTRFKQDLEAAGVRVISFGENKGAYSLSHLFKLARLMRHYDIVHTHNTAPQLFAAVGSLFCSTKLVTTEHNTTNRRRAWKWYRAIDRWMYNRYSKVICISRQAEVNLREFHRGLKCDISTIFNGVNVSRFHDATPASDIVRDGRTIVTMVAGFRHQKDQDTLIRAIAEMPRGKYHLLLVGDGVRRGELEELVQELGVEQDVTLLGIRSDVPQVLKVSDILVMSSHFEGLSLSNIEGMSVGKPFIASDVDGLREMTVDAGLLFPHEDHKALAGLIERLASDADYSRQIAARCWERASQYDISRMVEQYVEVYKTIH